MIAIVGGGWRRCLKSNFESIAVTVAGWGYVTANVSYRVAPAHRWPACAQDVKTALRWLRAHAGLYGLEPDRIGAIGSSAGGHLAAMLAVVPPEETFGGKLYTDQPGGIRAAVCICAPADMTETYQWHKEDGVTVDLLGGTPQELPELYRAASPLSHVSAASAPVLFIHGERDQTVPIEPSRRMSEKLRALGVDSPFVSLPGVGHGARLYVMQGGEGSPLPRVRSFLARHLAGEAA